MSARPDRRASAPARLGPRAAWIPMVAAVLLLGAGLSAPAGARPVPTGPGPGLFTIRPLTHLDQVLTVDPVSNAATCEEDSDDPEQLIRVRPVRNQYNVLNYRTDGYLDYYSDGRTGWTDRIAEWDVVAVDGFGDGVYLLRVLDLDGPPPEVLTYLGGDAPVTGLRAAAAPGDAVFEAQLWKFERATGDRAYSGELETAAGS